MKRVIVYHGAYGCETGCCGHYVDVLEPGDIYPKKSQFEFTHWDSDDESREEFVKRIVEKFFGKDHCKDINWDESLVVDYDKCPW